MLGYLLVSGLPLLVRVHQQSLQLVLLGSAAFTDLPQLDVQQGESIPEGIYFILIPEVPLGKHHIDFLAGQDHALEDTAVLSSALSSQILGVTAGSDVAEALLVLASLAEELLDLGAGIIQQRFYSLGLLLSRQHVHSKLVAAMLQHVQRVTSLYFFIVGSGEQFPFD